MGALRVFAYDEAVELRRAALEAGLTRAGQLSQAQLEAAARIEAALAAIARQLHEERDVAKAQRGAAATEFEQELTEETERFPAIEFPSVPSVSSCSRLLRRTCSRWQLYVHH